MMFWSLKLIELLLIEQRGGNLHDCEGFAKLNLLNFLKFLDFVQELSRNRVFL